MPIAPSILKSIKAVRKAMTSPDPKDKYRHELSHAVRELFHLSDEILANLESIEAVLSLAPEIEAFRGQGSQLAANQFARSIGNLGYELKGRLPISESDPDHFPKEAEIPASAKHLIDCFETLAVHALSRTQGPPVRSRHAGEIRAMAWKSLEYIAEILRRPEHLAHALKVADNDRASIEERIAAIGFLTEYWAIEDPDKATADLLLKLEKNAPDRDFLVTVLQAQIDLGLGNEFGALAAGDDWDDDEE